MNVTESGFKNRQLHMEDYLQIVSAEENRLWDLAICTKMKKNDKHEQNVNNLKMRNGKIMEKNEKQVGTCRKTNGKIKK